MHDNGDGNRKNGVEAIKWYKLAAAQGNLNVQFNLALTYNNEDGVPKNSSEAAKWYQLAENQEDTDA